MKIRLGFVSNSSSSSFVCWGIPSSEIGKAKGLTMDEVETTAYANKLDFGGQTDYYDDDSFGDTFVGIEPSTMMKDHGDMKFSEVKTFVAKTINKAFGTSYLPKDIQYTEQGWYNG